jgi:hypothetical protein
VKLTITFEDGPIAPELLAALERIEMALEHEPEVYADILSIARAAIAKAKGGAL